MPLACCYPAQQAHFQHSSNNATCSHKIYVSPQVTLPIFYRGQHYPPVCSFPTCLITQSKYSGSIQSSLLPSAHQPWQEKSPRHSQIDTTHRTISRYPPLPLKPTQPQIKFPLTHPCVLRMHLCHIRNTCWTRLTHHPNRQPENS